MQDTTMTKKEYLRPEMNVVLLDIQHILKTGSDFTVTAVQGNLSGDDAIKLSDTGSDGTGDGTARGRAFGDWDDDDEDF